MSRLSASALLVAALAGLTALSGCKILGLDGASCDPENPATCPAGQVCNLEGACVVGATGEGEGDVGEGEGDVVTGEGEGEGGEGEGEVIAPVIVAEENGVALVAVDVDDQIFFASDLQGGCIKRKVNAAASPENVVCEAGDRRIMAFTILGDDLFFLSDGAGATDRMRVIGRNATTADSPTTLSADDADIGSLALRGPDTIAARATDGVQFIAYVGGDDEVINVQRLSTGIVRNRSAYESIGSLIQPAALSVGPLYLAAACTFDGEVHLCADTGYDNADESGTFGFDLGTFFNRGGDYLNGRGWAGIAVADEHVWGNRAGDDSGGVFGFDDDSNIDGAAESRTIAAKADPENPLTYASGFATDNFALYWGTAGTIQAGRKFGVFSIDINDEAAVPVRIADLDGPAGKIALDGAGTLFVTVPGENELVSIDVTP